MTKKVAKKVSPKSTNSETNSGTSGLPFGVGDAIFIRTVTHHQVGRVQSIADEFIVLREASWVAESERFSVCLSTGALKEVERCPSWVMVSRGVIVDVFPWSHDLPNTKP